MIGTSNRIVREDDSMRRSVPSLVAPLLLLADHGITIYISVRRYHYYAAIYCEALRSRERGPFSFAILIRLPVAGRTFCEHRCCFNLAD
jgi:hypothetical protein